jgi:hypothetical protein
MRILVEPADSRWKDKSHMSSLRRNLEWMDHNVMDALRNGKLRCHWVTVETLKRET